MAKLAIAAPLHEPRVVPVRFDVYNVMRGKSMRAQRAVVEVRCGLFTVGCHYPVWVLTRIGGCAKLAG